MADNEVAPAAPVSERSPYDMLIDIPSLIHDPESPIMKAAEKTLSPYTEARKAGKISQEAYDRKVAAHVLGHVHKYFPGGQVPDQKEANSYANAQRAKRGDKVDENTPGLYDETYNIVKYLQDAAGDEPGPFAKVTKEGKAKQPMSVSKTAAEPDASADQKLTDSQLMLLMQLADKAETGRFFEKMGIKEEPSLLERLKRVK